mgnify:FL=1
MSIYVKRVFDCKLRLSGGYTFDVSSFSANYALNGIPTAEVILPLGREFDTKLLSNSYSFLTSSFIDRPAYLYLSFLDNSEGVGLNPNISTGTYLVFAGYPSNVQYVKTADNLQLKVTLRHWLSDLDFASTLSAASHPSNPKTLICNPKLQFGGLGSGLGFALAGIAQSIINPTYAAANLWGNAIFPFLRQLVLADRVNNSLFGTGNDCLNRAVLRALSSWMYSILPLNIAALGMTGVQRIMDSLVGLLDQNSADQFVSELAGTTLWKKLLDFARQFLFTIVPFPLYYRVEPIVLGLSNFYTTIPASEILHITTVLDRPTVPTRAVGVYGSFTPLLGSAIDNPEEASIDLIGGWYISSSLGYGLVEVLQAPRFLSGPFEPAYFTRAAVGGITDKTPLMRSPALRDLGVLEVQKNATLAHYAVLDELAHYYYIVKQLSNRTAVVTCPFRMDICPGSTVRLALYSQEQIPFEDGYLYGMVDSINYSLSDGESPKTIYNILGVRNQAEFVHPDFSTVHHPFYGIYFIGGMHR